MTVHRKDEEMPQISIVVPVYKVEPYLRECLDSILEQTFTDFELILVDDGSPDNCGAICDAYAAKDSRITVIHQKNAGVSAARNTGLDHVFENSDSQWVALIDSDDAIVPTYLEHLLRYAEEQNADISVTRYSRVPESFDLCAQNSGVHGVETVSGIEACLRMYSEDGTISVHPWSKLVRRELYRNIRYPEGRIYEDQYVIPRILAEAKRVAVLHAWLYCYRDVPGSIINQNISLRVFVDYVGGFDESIHYFKERQEKAIVLSAERKKRRSLLNLTWQARKAGIYKTLPKQYKLPLWKTGLYLLEDTYFRGGMKLIWVRIGNLIKKACGKAGM